MMKNEYENTLRPAKNQVASPQLLPARWTNERFHFAAHFCVGHPMLLCTDSFYLLISRSSEKNKLIIHSLCMLFAVIGGRRERHKVTLPLSLGLIMIDCIALTLAHFHFRTFMRPGSDSARVWKKVKLSMRMKINFSRWVDFIFSLALRRDLLHNNCLGPALLLLDIFLISSVSSCHRTHKWLYGVRFVRTF